MLDKVVIETYNGHTNNKERGDFMTTFTSEFMTERKKKVLETFEKILPMTTEIEDIQLESYMEGILKFKTNQREQKTA